MRSIGSAAELERRRRRAVQLADAGESPSVVARILGVTPPSLHRWRRLARQPAGLEALLNEGAVAHGWPNHLWTSKRVAVVIQRHFGVRYHPDHVRRLLN